MGNIQNKNAIENNKRSYKFSTKADTLLLLYNELHHASVLKIVLFTVEDFVRSQPMVLEKIQEEFSNQKIIVRSSAKAEDGKQRSLAGHFKSVLNVNANNVEEVISAINKVIESYVSENYNKNKLYSQQIFIQRQVGSEEIDISGVAFSYDPHSQAPYFFINYDNSGSTNSVTSGSGSKSIYLHRNFDECFYPWGQLVKALKEIEKIFSCSRIDVEFAILKTGQIIIFQVRKLFTKNKCLNVLRYDKLVCNSFGFIKNSDDIFSDMSFWNPAEMIGHEPHPLDYSLYESLITSKAWNEGIARIGYSIDNSNLMIHIGNHPYISIKKAVNSLIPQEINERIRSFVIKYCLEHIRNNPSSHDKIEFEVIFNCAYIGLKDEIEREYSAFLSKTEIDELYNALYNLTRNVISNYANLKHQDLIMLNKLRRSQEQFKKSISESKDVFVIISLIKEHIKYVSTYVAPQFALHARCAFISKKLLSSIVDNKAITTEGVDEFISSIPTIVTEFLADMRNKNVSDETLTEKYGHLRNSTYSIISKKYSDIGLRKLRGQNVVRESGRIGFEKSYFLEPISKYFSCGFDEIEDFIVGSIQMRELLKFEYSRSVSLILDAIEILAKGFSISSDEISFIDINNILKIKPANSIEKISLKIKSLSNKNKKKYDRNLALLCPAVVTSFTDCLAIKVSEDRPNFVTNKRIIADTVYCTEEMLNDNIENLHLNGKIVILEKAEPGNDWIFSKYEIAGLIAKYGGAASHMAIRCLEQGIPAALGCGEKIFRYASDCKKILLDCKSEVISKIS